MAIDESAESHRDDVGQSREPAAGERTEDDIGALAKQLGLSKEQAQSAADLVRGELAASSQRGHGTYEALPPEALSERFDVGDLLQVVGGGHGASPGGKQKPDLTQMAKDELAKAVAKKLGIDFETAGPIVEALLGNLLGKQTTPRRRRKPTQTGRKRPKAHGRPPSAASSSTRPKRRKAKKPAASSATAGDKPAAKKKRPRPSTGAGAASSGSASKPARRKPKTSTSSRKRKKPSSQRPAAAGSTSRPTRPRRRPATRSAPQTEESE